MNSLRRLLITRSSGMYTRSQSKQIGSYVFAHDESEQQFHLKSGSTVAVVEYNKKGDVLDLVHSFVPEAFRGKGVGRILAKRTFDYIDQHNLKMIVTCTFLEKVYEENKAKYKHLIEE